MHIKKVLEADLDVFNHNIETVQAFTKVRPGARYFASLDLLKNAKEVNKKDFHKIRDHGRAWRRQRGNYSSYG